MLGMQQLFFCLAIWMFWFSLFAYVPILPTYVKDLGASLETVGIILGSYGLTQALCRIPLGILSDRLNNRKGFIIGGMLICAVSGLGFWLFPSTSAVLFFRGFSGVAASVWVIHTVYFANFYPPEQTTKAMGIISSVLYAGEVAAMLTGGLAAYYLGVESTFIIAAVAGMLGFFFSLMLKENRPTVRKPLALADLTGLLKDSRLLIASALSFLMQALTFGTVFGFTPIAARAIGANNFELGLIPTLFMLPGILASALSGTFFTRQFGERASVVLGFLLLAASAAVVPFISNLQLFCLNQMIGGFARGLLFPLLMGYAIRGIDADRRASAMGFYQAIYGGGMTLGPIIVGTVGGMAGLQWGFGFAGLLACVGALLSLVLMKPVQTIENVVIKQ